jgi:N-carbamoyl-L-amino-acid hydrolase
MTMSIDRARLYASLEELGKIGRYEAPLPGGGSVFGVNRLALTDADRDGRRHVASRMKELGMTVTIDRVGNVYARREGTRPDLAPVMMGSHIDSVKTAGRFDGCLGVLGGLEVVRTLNDHGVRTARPVVVAFFTDEEGSRFGTDMLGSAVATGRIPIDKAYALADRTGATVRGELKRIGFLGEASEKIVPPHAYLECHIEQGPVLGRAGVGLGVVTGVQAIGWHELTIVGRSAHAGTTPMDMRSDPGVAAARIHVAVHEMAISGRYGDGMRVTVGVLSARPGLVNVVPSEIVCTVDLRNPDDAEMRRAEADVVALYERIAREERVELSWRRTARTDTVAFSPGVQERVAAAASARGLSHQRIVSGAGHDAQEMARICRAGMIFVPGENDGISHNPLELSTPEQCGSGVDVLLDVLLSFASEENEP